MPFNWFTSTRQVEVIVPRVPLPKPVNMIPNLKRLMEIFVTQYNDLQRRHTEFNDILNQHQTSSEPVFRDVCSKEDICPICHQLLLGPCVIYKCKCKAVLHESCMAKIVLNGFNTCPICQLEMALKFRESLYAPKIDLDKSFKLIDKLSLTSDIDINSEAKKVTVGEGSM